MPQLPHQMRSAGVQIACVSLGVLGLIGVIVCCAVPHWTVTTFKGDCFPINPQSVMNGLWMSCVVQSTGQLQCKNYDSLLVLASDLQAARPMTIISCILSCLSLLILLILSRCTCVQNEDAKPKISLVAGIGLMLAGLLVIIPVSWSTHIVLQDFNNPLFVNELGVCIFVGWVAGVLLLLAGGLLCCFSRPKSGSSGGNTYGVLQQQQQP